MAAHSTIAIVCALFGVVSNASVGGQPECAKGSCPAARDTVMLQKMALQHRSFLHMKARSSAEAAYTAQLWRTVHAAHASREPATDELQDVIENVASHQADSEEQCATQLRDAKDHLSKLHETVDDLATEINSTQTAVRVQQYSLASKQDDETEVNEWKDKQKRKCDNERDDRKRTLKTLKQDLAALKEISAQTNATASTGAALLEESSWLRRKPVSDVRRLVLLAKSAASALAECGKKTSTQAQLGVSLIEAPTEEPTPEDCQKAKRTLEQSITKPYVELTRQVAENEDLVESTSCEDTVREEFKSKMAPIQRQTEKFASKLEDAVAALSELRPRLDDGRNAQKKLEEKVDKLGEECQSLPETRKNLEKIKDVIKVLDKCPGLAKAKINLPTWINEWVTIRQDADESDEALDSRLNEACAESKGVQQPVRAAEVGEILSLSVAGMPSTNTAKETLIGACPFCAGDDDVKTGMKHAGGHARVGWDTGVAFTEKAKRHDLSTGVRAVLCVRDSIKEDASNEGAALLSSTPGAVNAILNDVGNQSDDDDDDDDNNNLEETGDGSATAEEE